MAETLENGLIIENGIVTNGKACEGEITVPDGVTAIADKAFYNNRKLTGLVLPQGLLRIGKYAVSGCRNLAYVQVPDSVAELGESALMKKFESDVGFTHVMENIEHYPLIRLKAGCYVDEALKALKATDGFANGHGVRHIIEFEYV